MQQTACTLFQAGLVSQARRTAKFLIKRQKTLSPKIPGKGTLEFSKLSQATGLQIYEQDLEEQCIETLNLLEKMTKDEELLKSFYKEPVKGDFCFETVEEYTYDFTRPKQNLSVVKMHINMCKIEQKLEFNDTEIHSFLSLVGNKFDPENNTVVLQCKGQKHQCIKELLAQFDQLVKASKENNFNTVGLNLNHVKPKKANLNFPEQWIK